MSKLKLLDANEKQSLYDAVSEFKRNNGIRSRVNWSEIRQRTKLFQFSGKELSDRFKKIKINKEQNASHLDLAERCPKWKNNLCLAFKDVPLDVIGFVLEDIMYNKKFPDLNWNCFEKNFENIFEKFKHIDVKNNDLTFEIPTNEEIRKWSNCVYDRVIALGSNANQVGSGEIREGDASHEQNETRLENLETVEIAEVDPRHEQNKTHLEDSETVEIAEANVRHEQNETHLEDSSSIARYLQNFSTLPKTNESKLHHHMAPKPVERTLLPRKRPIVHGNQSADPVADYEQGYQGLRAKLKKPDGYMAMFKGRRVLDDEWREVLIQCFENNLNPALMDNWKAIRQMTKIRIERNNERLRDEFFRDAARRSFALGKFYEIKLPIKIQDLSQPASIVIFHSLLHSELENPEDEVQRLVNELVLSTEYLNVRDWLNQFKGQLRLATKDWFCASQEDLDKIKSRFLSTTNID